MSVWVAEYVYKSYDNYSYYRIGLFTSLPSAKLAAEKEDYFPKQQGWATHHDRHYVAFDLGRATIQVYEVKVEE